MDAIQMIMESRMRDQNPFRDMLQKMGAFGGPTMQDMAGAAGPPQQGGGPEGGGQVPPQLAAQFQQIVQALIAKGMPKEMAIKKAVQIIQQMAAGGGGGPAGGAPPPEMAGMGGAAPPEEDPPPEMGPMAGFAGG